MHTYLNTYTHTHTHKMVDKENQQVENTFNTLVNITEKSGNLRKNLTNDTLETVSTLRKTFS